MQSGEIGASSAVVWSRSDRPATMLVEWSTSRSFRDARRVVGPRAAAEGGLVAKAALVELPSATRIHYRVRFDAERASDWIEGSFGTAPSPSDAREVVFAFSADVNGQGWGIDPTRGGMPAFTALAARAPDFFVCLGDAIYADDPIPPSIALPSGGPWKNLVTAAKSHVAETLDDFRGAHLYPRHAREVRAFAAEVPSFFIWDDHEVRNNWFPTQRLEGPFDDPRYHEKDVDALARLARRAFDEQTPQLRDPRAPAYRSLRWGAHLEVFLLDGRSYRTPNWPVAEPARFLGEKQLAWLEGALTRSTATWKVVACDMPISLVVSEPAPRGGRAWDGIANDDGPPSGRELELARLFGALAARGTKNVVFVTADVHYASAIRYARAPVREFVAGPLHAAAFGRKPADDTFGPEVEFANAGWDRLGTPAQPETQSFGLVRIDAATGTMTVTLVDGTNRDLHVTVLLPE